MTTPFKLRSGLLILVAGALIHCESAYAGAASTADSTVSQKTIVIPKPLHSNRDVASSVHASDVSDEQKEYVRVAGDMRLADAAFVENMRKAGPAEKRSLRLQQVELMQPKLRRINELARALRKNQPQGSRNSGPAAVPVEGVPHPADEIAGKTLDELARLGVPVDVLHQRAEEPETSGSRPPQSNSKK